LDELIKAVDLARAVGERPYGHFDHDANLLSGPFARNRRALTMRSRKKDTAQIEKPTVISNTLYEAYEDPETGEVLYRPVEG
jgi:hypothetical protein